MVQVNIIDTNHAPYEKWYNSFSFPLSDFQKIAIQSLVQGHHSLTCVPTGSGKTVPALFAIDYFTKHGKKIIYTAPIKALSNQKFDEFSNRFPHLSIGIITGDIKLNPSADVLIMTAEILQNQFISNHSLSDLDIAKEVGCIIHDEIHMINDKDRGHVWEQLLMKHPPSIQLVLLSATLDDPYGFAEWIETIGHKQVCLGENSTRLVPLQHMGFVHFSSTLRKRLREDSPEIQFMESISGQFVPFYQSNGIFESDSIEKCFKSRKIMKKSNYTINILYCIESVIKHLVEHDMLPAVCFVLSKKQIEFIASSITVDILPFDTKVPYTIEKICKSILRKKFSNHEEIFMLEEFHRTIKLFERGMAIHHSGMIPILRELTEILFQQGYIKFLFATETFSVGLNMPIRTTIFTDLYKFDGNSKRLFYPHEFKQSAGRAGRRGIDEKGYVIHLFNLYSPQLEMKDVQTMLLGSSPSISSKFKFSYHMFFYEPNIMSFYNTSLHSKEFKNYLSHKQDKLNHVQQNLLSTKEISTPNEIIEKYQSLCRAKSSKKLKKNKQIQTQLCEQYPNLLSDISTFDYQKKKQDQYTLQKQDFEIESNQKSSILTKIYAKLCEMEYMHDATLTSKGIMASKIHLVPCLPMIEFLDEISSFSAVELVEFFSCLFPVSSNTRNPDSHLENFYKRFLQFYHDMEYFENDIETGEQYYFNPVLSDFAVKWIDVSNVEECRKFLCDLKTETGIFVGEFFKLMLNINNLSDEFCQVAQCSGNMTFLQQLQQIPSKTLKFLVTNQSLYV